MSCFIFYKKFSYKNRRQKHEVSVEHVTSSEKDMDSFDGTLKHPFTCIVAGPTGCGKTRWVRRLLEKAGVFVDPPPERVYWYYGEYQPDYNALKAVLPHVEFVEGLPSEDEIKRLDPNRRNFIVLDDLMNELTPVVSDLFTKGSHHRNISVILLVQNLFFKGGRTLSLNTHYLVFFKNPRDASSIDHLARQMFPGRVRYVREAYADATAEPFGYLFVDFRPSTPDRFRLQSGLFGNRYVYMPR